MKIATLQVVGNEIGQFPLRGRVPISRAPDHLFESERGRERSFGVGEGGGNNRREKSA